MILIDQSAETTADAADAYTERIPSGPAIAGVVNSLLKKQSAVYVPGWPGLIVATERTGSSWEKPWIALTDEGGLFVDPQTRIVEDSYGVFYDWPSTLTTIEGITADGEPVAPSPVVNVEAAEWSIPPAAIAAGAALLALLFVR